MTSGSLKNSPLNRSLPSFYTVVLGSTHPKRDCCECRNFSTVLSRPEEPLEQLADDLKRYLQFAMPDTPLQQQDVLLKFQLLRSLPGDLAEKLEIHQHIMSFDELVTKARLSLLERKSSSPSIAVVQPIP